MSREGAATHAGPRARMVTKSIYFFVFVERTNKRHHHQIPQWGASLARQWLHTAAGRDGTWVARTGSEPMLMCGDIFAAFPVADDWASAFQPSCCCWQGTWPGRLCWQDGRLLGPVPEAARSPQPAVCLNTSPAQAMAPFPGGWSWCETEANATLSVANCDRGTPSSTSASTSCLSSPVLPRRL